MKKLMIAILSILLLASCKAEEDDTLVRHFPLDETGGETTTEQVTKEDIHVFYKFNSDNATLLYKEPSDPMWRNEGVAEGALLFDGYTTYLSDDSFDHPTEAMTIALWVAPRAFEWGDQGKFSPFVSQLETPYNAGYLFGMYRHGRWGLQLGIGNSYIASIETFLAPDDHRLDPNVWTHVAATFDQDAVRLYQNGELVATHDLGDYKQSPINEATVPLLIGKHNDPAMTHAFSNNMFSGLMDDIRIQNVALDDDGIAALYESYLDGGEHPVLDYATIAFDPTIYDGDRYRPQYHAIPPEHWMNEPHAPFYYNGYYHLFYQFNPYGPFWHQIHWGHWVSEDMVNWINLDVAIRPHEPVTPDGVWSGSAHYDENGDPVLFITAGNDSISPNQNVAICRPADLTDPYLREWDCEEDLAIRQGPGEGKPGEFRDPFVFQQDGVWYLLNGSGTTTGNGGTAVIYSSTDLESWTFHGNFYETDFDAYPYMGANWELPVYLPLRDENGQETEYGMLMVSPHPPASSDVEIYYWLGRFNVTTKRFEALHDEPRLMDHGDGVFTGPSGFVDPVTGRSIVFGIAQSILKNQQTDYYLGWAHNASFPISVWIDSATLTLRFEPIEEVANLRSETLVHLEDGSIETANEALASIGGDTIEIILELTPEDAEKAGIYIRQSATERTDIYYDFLTNQLVLNSILSSESTIGVQRRADVPLVDGMVRIHILLDRSMVEIYANDIASIASRIYPVNGDSMGLTLYSKNGEVTVSRISVYQMTSVFTEELIAPYYETE